MSATTPTIRLAVVRDARRLFARTFPNWTPHNNCVAVTWATITAARGYGIDMRAFGGSACWPMVADHLDDGVSANAFGYGFDPTSEATRRALSEKRLPEIHAWAGIPATGEFVDVTTGHWPMQAAELMGYDWTATRPPDFLWSREQEFPYGVRYEPTIEGGAIVVATMRSMLGHGELS